MLLLLLLLLFVVCLCVVSFECYLYAEVGFVLVGLLGLDYIVLCVVYL